jgi:hypothetical protein
MLVCLQEYLVDYYGVSFDGFVSMIDVSVLQDHAITASNSAAVAASATAAAVPTAGTTPASSPSSSNYWLTLLIAVREDLLSRVDAYLTQQLHWIQAQRSDPKKAAAAVCVSKLPNLLRQLLEMVGRQNLMCVNKVMVYLIQATYAWINALSAQNEKYTPMVRMHNYGLLDRALSELMQQTSATSGASLAPNSPTGSGASNMVNIDVLKQYADTAAQEFKQARTQYISWQMSSNFEALAAASRRIESCGSRIKQDELVLYIRK